MREYKIVFGDLDGTMLNSHSKVSDENCLAIEALHRKGVAFVPSTGRSFSEVPDEIYRNPFIRYYICSNGAYVLDKQTGHCHLTCMSNQTVQSIVAILRRFEAHLTLRCGGGCHVDANYVSKEAFDYYNVIEAHRVVVNAFSICHEEFEAFCESAEQVEVISVFFRNHGDLLASRKAIEELGSLRVVSVGENNLEIMNADAGKGNALLWLAKHLGVNREETVSVGDSDNDSNIIAAAGLGLAVSNACQSLKDIADEIVCSNDEHVLQEIVNRYF